MTARLLEVLADRYLAGETAADLARWCGLSERGLRELLNDVVDERLQAPRDSSQWREVTHIGIDEVFWGGRILCTILDLRTGKLLDLLPDRQPSTLQAFLDDLNTLRPGLPPPIFVTDMWAEYRQVLRRLYGADLRHVVDRFHLQAKLSEDLTDVVRMILPATSFRPKQIRAVQQAFVQALRGSSVELSDLGNATRVQIRQLKRAITVAVQLRDFWRSENAEMAEQRLQAWEWRRAVFEFRLRTDGTLQPFSRLAYLLQEWRTEILTYFDPDYHLPGGVGPTTGRLEAVNGVIRRFLLESRHPRRKPFAAYPEHWDEQQQFDRLWLRVMHRVNRVVEKAVPVVEIRRPVLSPCQCGAPPETCDVQWTAQGATWDRPLGLQPLKIVHETARLSCPTCGQRWQVASDLFPAVTPELQADLLAWRKEGHSLRTLNRWTGVPTARIKRLTDEALPMPHIYYAELIGLQRWKWRKKDYWMITDPRQGRLIDLLPVASDSGEWADHAEVLRTWVERAERRGTQRVLVGSLEWAEESEESPGVPGVPNPLAALYVLADRFTTVSLVHQALREVAWRYQQGLSVAARRSPERLRTRFLLLANPGRYRRLDDRIDQARLRARREALLGSTPILLLAAEMMAELRRVTTLDEDDDLMGSLSRWIDMVQALDLSDHPEPLEKSLYFAFQNAAAKLRQHVEAIEAGLALQAAEQVSLASSRRMIRSLNEFRASRQGDFEFLRRSALHVFGAPT